MSIHTSQHTRYDMVETKRGTYVNRRDNLDMWIEANWDRYTHDWIAPDGAIYCSPGCAIINNIYRRWKRSDLRPLSVKRYKAMRESAPPGEGPACTCPCCWMELHGFVLAE